MVENTLTRPEGRITKTGIRGLDDVLLGGIPCTNSILVQGAAGTGKTLLGMEFIYRGIIEYHQPGIIVVFETSPAKLIRDAALFDWNLDDLQRKNQLKIIFTSPSVLETELLSPRSLLLETVTEMGAERMFIDGIGLLGTIRSPPVAGAEHSLSAGGLSSGGFDRPTSYRGLLQQLLEGLDRENLTCMMSHEVGLLPESLATLEAAGFLCDTVLELSHDRVSRRGHRSVEIVKSRGQKYVAGKHTLRITSGRGLEVFRRVQAPIIQNLAQPTSTAKRSLIGVQALDDLIGGGLFDGSTTMVVGISGAGKTVLGGQLLREGAIRDGKRGLLISLDEHPAQIVRNSETLGLDLQTHIDSGMIRIFYESPQELEVDSHFARIVETIEKYDIQRLVIDGVTSYSSALDTQRAYRDFFHALVAYSKFRLMTTFFNYENPELFGLSSYMPEFPVSSIVDNIIVLSLVELGNSVHRCIAVVKARGCKHEFETREFTIGQGGITLLPLDHAQGLTALPIENYSSVLSRAPTRESPRRGAARRPSPPKSLRQSV
ncbi:MAG TPA: ATPase domain-containing protein [Bryobacteraceae bacterium]|nr:ATPase domain-containing protein [Bryobacteraceae bacterium]